MENKTSLKKSQEVKPVFRRRLASKLKVKNFRKLQLSEKGDSIIFFLFGTVMILALVIAYFSFYQKIQAKEENLISDFKQRWK